MKRKVLSLLLCGLLACSMLTACGGSGKASTEAPATEEKQTKVETAASAAGDVVASNVADKELIADEESTKKIYTVSKYDISNELQEFFTLWLGCQLDCALGNEKTRVVDMDSMLKHGRVVGSIVSDKKLHVAYEYDNKQFKGLGGSSNYVDVALKNRTNVNYGTSVSMLYTNFYNFRYYEGTDATLSVVAEVTCNIDNEPVKFAYGENITFAVTLTNNKSNPEEWLITGVYYLRPMEKLTQENIDVSKGINSRVWGEDGSNAKANGFDISTRLVSENAIVHISGDHDFRVSIDYDYIDYLELGKDGYLTLRASCNLYDDYTRDPSRSPDSFSCAVASDCTIEYYGETIPDADSFIKRIMKDIQDAKNNNRHIYDATLQVFIDDGKIIVMRMYHE